VYDDIDLFHQQADNNLLFGFGNRRSKFIQKEVLSVRVDDDDSSAEEVEEQSMLFQF
jgi:hypothetical protein